MNKWSEEFETNKNGKDANELWIEFKDAFSHGASNFIPSKKIRKQDRIPGVNRKTRSLVKKRNKAFRDMKNLRSEENRLKFKDLKEKVQQEIRRNYENYIEDLIDPNLDKGNKKLWFMVKRIKKDSSGVGPLKVDGRLISDSKEKANVLNEQFKSVFNEKITNDLPDMGHSPFGPMQNFNITVPGITELLKTPKIHKAAGSDGIVPRLLSELSDQLAPPLTIIFNKSIESGIVPEDWRQANVAPIFKKGEKYRPSNYRPVSLTCICCKLLEHIVVRSLMEPLENNKILYDWQHGFRSKRSTETQLVTLI